jgi:8-oxo-dGTP pyrophosphatase MutT (NUDIX family)
MQPKPWQQVSSQTVLQDRWMTLRADVCELSDGHRIEPYYVIEERDWAHCLAVTPDNRIILVRQYRHAAGVFCTELPGGVIDDGESPLQAVQRELHEETGYAADDWLALGSFYANPARQTNRVHLFVARDARLAGEPDPDPGEELVVLSVSVDEVVGMIAAGEFSQGLHIASFYRCLHEGDLPFSLSAKGFGQTPG